MVPQSGEGHETTGPGRELDLIAVRPCGCARMWRRGSDATERERLEFYRDAAKARLEVLLLETEEARGRFGRDCSVCKAARASRPLVGEPPGLLAFVGARGAKAYYGPERDDLLSVRPVGPGREEDVPTGLGGGLGLELGGVPPPRSGPSREADRG
jgi:hypothetical protein